MLNKHILKRLCMQKGLNKMNKDIMKEIIENIKENADELKSKEKLNEVEFGELLGYMEALTIMKGACAGYDVEELGLGFDIEKEYLK